MPWTPSDRRMKVEGAKPRVWFDPQAADQMVIHDSQQNQATALYRTRTEKRWVKQVDDRYIQINDTEATRLINGEPSAPRQPNRRRPTRGIGISDVLYQRLQDRAAKDGGTAADILEDALKNFLDR